MMLQYNTMASYKDITVQQDQQGEHLLGRVKWFNNKSGYGFITVTDGTQTGTDVFVHHSGIGVADQQYKYLVQGEYVEFDLIKTSSDKHEWQASRVSGIKGGKLMCETRHEVKVSRNEYMAVQTEEPRQRPVRDERPRQDTRQRQKPDARQKPDNRPRQTDTPRETNKEWSLVGDKGKPVQRQRKPLN